MQSFDNPILPGFHPDPCICRVGDDFYIATSTFEWFPGVMIHHSRDLVHWRCLGPALQRQSQLDMRGNPDSCGVWAPCLTYADELFWLIYSDTKSWQQGYKDVHNWLVTCQDIQAGDWSEPIYLNASGFDPSLFHDPDGSKWLLNQLWDHRPERHSFAGIVMQEYDHQQGRLVGPVQNIFRGTEARVTEGPHLLFKDGWYYLITAEGGTGPDHCVTVARSRSRHGPYEVHPDNPILTSRDDPSLVLQKAGHASLVETSRGEWWMAHLTSRPVQGNSILGRETALQRLQWDDDAWPRLTGGGRHPRLTWPLPDLPPAVSSADPECVEWSSDDCGLPPFLQSLRIPVDASWCSLSARPGFLRLYGQESLASRHRTSLLARRLQHFSARASLLLEMEPRDFQHMAGLVAIYDSASWSYLYLSRDEERGRVLRLARLDNGRFSEDQQAVSPIGEEGPVELVLQLRDLQLHWFWRLASAESWQAIGSAQDAAFLGDEYGHHGHFTGAMIGLACQDLSGQRASADFGAFSLSPLSEDEGLGSTGLQ